MRYSLNELWRKAENHRPSKPCRTVHQSSCRLLCRLGQGTCYEPGTEAPQQSRMFWDLGKMVSCNCRCCFRVSARLINFGGRESPNRARKHGALTEVATRMA